MKKIIFSAAVIIIVAASCKTTKKTETTVVAEAPVDCASVSSVFSTDIKPIFEKHCVSCHSDGGRGGYDFTLMEDIVRGAKNGDILGAIKWKEGFRKMPARAGKLDNATISKIECWINNGMKP